jgi:hypothetical protein
MRRTRMGNARCHLTVTTQIDRGGSIIGTRILRRHEDIRPVLEWHRKNRYYETEEQRALGYNASKGDAK